MSNVVGGNSGSYDGGRNNSGYGGSGYGGSGYGGSGYGGGSNYDSYSSKNKKESSSYNYGNEGLGVYGDYTYNKSTLDKYKDKKEE